MESQMNGRIEEYNTKKLTKTRTNLDGVDDKKWRWFSKELPK